MQSLVRKERKRNNMKRWRWRSREDKKQQTWRFITWFGAISDSRVESGGGGGVMSACEIIYSSTTEGMIKDICNLRTTSSHFLVHILHGFLYKLHWAPAFELIIWKTRNTMGLQLLVSKTNKLGLASASAPMNNWNAHQRFHVASPCLHAPPHAQWIIELSLTLYKLDN